LLPLIELKALEKVASHKKKLETFFYFNFLGACGSGSGYGLRIRTGSWKDSNVCFTVYYQSLIFVNKKYSTGLLAEYIRCQMTERCRGCPLAREGEEQQEQEILLKPADRLALRLIAPEKGHSCLSSSDVIMNNNDNNVYLSSCNKWYYMHFNEFIA
jgi:hypothetical protein